MREGQYDGVKMSGNPGRNEPCPCGSGRKYKRCCSRRRQEAARARSATDGTVGRVLSWIAENHAESAQQELEELYFGSLSDEEKGELGELPDDLHEMVLINSQEWLIADGELLTGDGWESTISLALGPDGPILSAEGRGYLEELQRNPLQPYRIVESIPGQALVLQDYVDRASAPRRVVERAGSQALQAGDLILARVVAAEVEVLSGAIYGLSTVESVVAQAVSEWEQADDVDPDDLSLDLIDIWLRALMSVTRGPVIVDAATGEAAMFVTDHYRIRDRGAFDNVLARLKEVEGDAENGWVRLEEPGVAHSRVLLGINPGKRSDRIELFSRSVPLAESNKSWFEEAFDATVAFVTREISDPVALLKRRPAEKLNNSEIEITPEIREQIHRRVYRNWVEDEIPALGDVSPRNAVRTVQGRREVTRLLESYEVLERRRAREAGEEPANFDFLWDELELDRSEIDR